MSGRSAMEQALLERQLESASLFDDRERIAAEHEITAEAITGLGLEVRRCLLLACGPSGHHAARFQAGHPGAWVLSADLSLPFVGLARGERARPAGGRALFAVADMRALPHAGGCFDLIGLYGNSFGFFDHAGNLEVLREMARCLRPGGLAVVTVPRFDYIAGFTAEAPLRWEERAETPRGTLLELGERYYDPRRGLSAGHCEQRNLTTGERSARTGLTSRIYPLESPSPAQPGLAAMAAECGFAASALVPIPAARTANAKGLMSRMDCLVLTR